MPRISTRPAAGLAVLAIAVLAMLIADVAAQEPGKLDDPVAIDRKIIDAAKSDSEIMRNLTYLSDQIGPRVTGSAHLRRANMWAVDKFMSYGVTASLETWTLPVAWERGTASARVVEPDNGVNLTVASAGWTPGTHGKIVGDVVIVDARTPEELKQYEGKLRGAIVLRGKPADVRPVTELTSPFGSPPPRADAKAKADEKAKGEGKSTPVGRPGGFNARAFGEMQKNRREVAEILRREGVAVILSDAAKPHGLLTMTGNWGGSDRTNAPDPLPALFVAHEHYAMLHRLASRPGPARTRVEVEITNKLTPGPFAVFNTVGEIKGSDKADEFVVVGAHLDSWDLGQGTTDNGTGTCVVLEAARLLAKCGVKPRRTIRFVLFTGEEQGLHGSRAYVARHKDEMPRTTAAIVHDTGTGRITGVSLMGREILKPIMEAELTSLKELGVTEFNLRRAFGSDHQSFESADVPGFMFRQDPAEYRLTHHSQSDTLDKAREPDLVQGAQVMAVIAMRLANRDDLLPRDKPAEPEGSARRP